MKKAAIAAMAALIAVTWLLAGFPAPQGADGTRQARYATLIRSAGPSPAPLVQATASLGLVIDPDGRYAHTEPSLPDLNQRREGASVPVKVTCNHERTSCDLVVGSPTPSPYLPPTVAAAKAYARSRLSAAQFHCLDLLWTKESHWHPTDPPNPRSGAYGIPQAVPGSKMRSAGADWRTNPVTQVRWGLGYIHGRYGTPCNAWAHSRRHNWY